MVDLNRILAWLNAIILSATIVAFFQVGANDYMDGTTVALTALLALQTHVALALERRRRDPFVIVLAFILVFYFSLRVLTLLLLPFSVVLDRFPYLVADSNVALLFIVVANVFLYAGFYVVRGNSPLKIDVGSWRPKSPRRALMFVAAAMALIYFRGAIWNLASTPRVVQVVLVFASQSVVVLMALAYYLLFRQQLTRRVGAAFVLLLVLEMVLHTLAGSRSAFVYALQNALVVLLAVGGSIALRRRVVFAVVAGLPLIIALLVGSFIISTVIAAAKTSGAPMSLTTALEASTTAGVRLDRQYAMETGLPLIFSRAGFFDYSAEVIAHRREYQKVINVPAYSRSIADNLLTPGYDLFDQPKIANALKFVYHEQGKVSKTASAEAYQSDQLGIYGELFVLFGYAALPLFFVGAFLLKRVYFALHDANPFALTMKRAVTLAVFAQIVNSFGFDWIIADLVPLIVAIYVYRPFFTAAPILASRTATV